MLTPGIVSVTYRQLTPAALLDAARKAQLSVIEWGGDVHVPHGDISRAIHVGGMTRGAGLLPVSYGTYYRAGSYGSEYPAVFTAMLRTAEALGASNLRLWAGCSGSIDTDAVLRTALTNELRHCAQMAKNDGKSISFEYHSGTLTDRADSARRLMEALGADNASLYWQPNQFLSHEENCSALQQLLPYISNVHVFAWEGSARLPLAAHAQRWRNYISILKTVPRDRAMLLEFTPNDDPAELAREAEVLRSLL